MVGKVPVGGGAPVAVQTMTKTETANLAATMDQIHKVAEALLKHETLDEPDAYAAAGLGAREPVA